MAKATEEIVALFNAKRENKKGVEFNRSQMMEELKKLNIPANDSMLCALTSGVNPPIMRIRRGCYMYNKDAVYKDRLQTCFNMYNNRSENYKPKQLNEEDCIEFLKSTGKYEIYRVIKKLEKI